MSHQVGSFVGAYGGGLIYDALGSYNMAWRIGVAVGLAASIVQIAFALNQADGAARAANGIGIVSDCLFVGRCAAARSSAPRDCRTAVNWNRSVFSSLSESRRWCESCTPLTKNWNRL